MTRATAGSLARAPGLAALLVSACFSPEQTAELAGTTSLASGGVDSTGGDSTDSDGGVPALAVTPIRGVDLLFVVDSSGSMARAQGLLALAGPQLLAALDGVDLRIAFTTTDVGNPRCQDTTPEDGAFAVVSCLDHAERFEFDGEDHWAAACLACSHSDAELARAPTPTALEPTPAPRAWLERAADGTANVSVELGAAFACAAPPGIDGCGYESPLAAVRRALERAATPGDGNHGFVRDDAVLAIVIVSDETDCSAQDPTIFTTNKTFWPDDVHPTSAACWYAGVACTGDPPTFTDCAPVDRDAAGASGVDADAAVLVPATAYVDELRALADARAASNPAQRLVMHLVSGVPPGYAEYLAELDYVAAPADAVSNFGIGPGCTHPDGRAGVPPVRERVVAEAFAPDGARNVDSICADDFAPGLVALAEELRDMSGRACLPGCVADRDPSTPEREPDCVFTRADLPPTDVEALIPACVGDEFGGYTAPLGYAVCHRVHPAPSTGCAARGHNAEISLVSAAPGEPLPDVRVTCAESEAPQLDCPGLAP